MSSRSVTSKAPASGQGRSGGKAAPVGLASVLFEININYYGHERWESLGKVSPSSSSLHAFLLVQRDVKESRDDPDKEAVCCKLQALLGSVPDCISELEKPQYTISVVRCKELWSLSTFIRESIFSQKCSDDYFASLVRAPPCELETVSGLIKHLYPDRVILTLSPVLYDCVSTIDIETRCTFAKSGNSVAFLGYIACANTKREGFTFICNRFRLAQDIGSYSDSKAVIAEFVAGLFQYMGQNCALSILANHSSYSSAHYCSSPYFDNTLGAFSYTYLLWSHLQLNSNEGPVKMDCQEAKLGTYASWSFGSSKCSLLFLGDDEVPDELKAISGHTPPVGSFCRITVPRAY